MQSRSVQTRYLLGLSQLAVEDYVNATGTLKPLWESQANNMSYLYALALSADKAGQPDLEKAALDRIFEIGEGSAECHLFLGRAWLARQRDDEAIQELQKAAQISPKLAFVHYSLATAYAAKGDYEAAKSEFLKDIEIDPDFASDYDQLGAVYLKLDAPTEAERAFTKAIRLDPKLASSYFALAKIYRSRRLYAAALRMIDTVDKLDSKSASAHYLRAEILTQMKRNAEAKTEFALSSRLRQSARDRLERQVSGTAALDAQMGLGEVH